MAGCSILETNNRGSNEEQNTAGGLHQTSKVYVFPARSQVDRVSPHVGLPSFSRKTLLLTPSW